MIAYAGFSMLDIFMGNPLVVFDSCFKNAAMNVIFRPISNIDTYQIWVNTVSF